MVGDPWGRVQAGQHVAPVRARNRSSLAELVGEHLAARVRRRWTPHAVHYCPFPSAFSCVAALGCLLSSLAPHLTLTSALAMSSIEAAPDAKVSKGIDPAHIEKHGAFEEDGGIHDRPAMERKLLWKLDTRFSILIIMYERTPWTELAIPMLTRPLQIYSQRESEPSASEARVSARTS